MGGIQAHHLVILQEDVKVAGSWRLPPGSSRVHQAVTRPAHVGAVSAVLLPSLLPACFAAAHRYLLHQGVVIHVFAILSSCTVHCLAWYATCAKRKGKMLISTADHHFRQETL